MMVLSVVVQIWEAEVFRVRIPIELFIELIKTSLVSVPSVQKVQTQKAHKKA